MPAGYSKTPLVKKLGIKENYIIKPVNAPENYFQLLETLPEGVAVAESNFKRDIDFIHYFETNPQNLSENLPKLRTLIRSNGMIWVSWDKTKSKKEGFVNENLVRQYAFPLGLVDIKVCAVDETWSALKLVIRKENR